MNIVKNILGKRSELKKIPTKEEIDKKYNKKLKEHRKKLYQEMIDEYRKYGY